MSASEILDRIARAISPLEMVAVAAGLACVWLTTRQNLWCWGFGLVQVTLYGYIFFQARLYSDALLHLIYIGLQFYGWYAWRFGSGVADTLPVSRLSSGEAAGWSVFAAIGTAGLGFAMDRLAGADFAYPDAAIAVLSLIAQYLLARKILENWAIWMVVDVLGIGVYSAKELYLTAGLYTVFLGLCVWGLLSWKRTLPATAPA